MNARTLQKPALCTLYCGIALLFAACGGEQDIPAGPPAGEPVALSIGSARLTAAADTRGSDSSAPGTRAGGTVINTDGAKLRLFRTAGIGGYDPMYDVACTYSGGKWTSEHPIYMDSRKAAVYACYDPHSVVSFGANSTTTSSTISFGDYADNQMWYFDSSHTEVDCFSAEPDFTLQCAYSRMAFHIARDADYPNACKVSNIRLQPTTGTFTNAAKVDLATGKLTGGAALATYNKDTKSLSMYTTGIPSDTPDTSVELSIPAQDLPATAQLKISLTVDGTDYSATLTPAQLAKFEGSVRCTVYLSIKGTGLKVSSVTTTEWVTGDIGGIDSKFD